MDTKTLNCGTCNKEISKLANACPNCGAPNDWVHPSVADFMANLNDYKEMPEFQAYSDKTSATGISNKPSGPALGALCFIAGVLILGLVAVLAFDSFYQYKIQLVMAVGLWIAKLPLINLEILGFVLLYGGYHFSVNSVVRFDADFKDGTFKWTSNDDKFWAEVKTRFENNFNPNL
jgi:hypothetical protein